MRSLVQVQVGPLKDTSFSELDEGNEGGGVAQLGEHLPCKQGVSGSNPLVSMVRGEAARGNRSLTLRSMRATGKKKW